MFLFAILIGIYSYCIFFLGIVGLLYAYTVILFTISFWGMSLVWKRKRLLGFARIVWTRWDIKNKKLFLILLSLVILQACVNLIGALGPELAFDALWYHLTLPKLYLLNHSIYHIPGGLLYYSDMPKLGEMLYVAGLSFGNEITVKVIHFSFGIFVSIALYLFSRKFFSPLISVIAVVIFYANLVVAWESITAYIDLIRTFYELLALWAFVYWWQMEKRKWLYISALMIGLAITTKLLALGSVLIFSLLIIYKFISNKRTRPFLLWKNIYSTVLTFVLVALLVPLPWLLFAYFNTGNPVYPFFSEIYQVVPQPLSFTGFITDVWQVFTQAADPISPVYLIIFPLLFITFSKLQTEVKIVVWYSALSIVVWYFTPRTGGGRFLLPYLPALSIVCAGIIAEFFKRTRKEYTYVSYFLLGIIIFVSVLSIGYRSAANYKYIPVIIGQQSKEEFLSHHLEFSFADYYDTDGYFAKNIKPNETVLLYGFHNLYYVEFPFTHESWIEKGDEFRYVATQRAELSERFANWQLLYSNDKTMVNLYGPPEGDCDNLCVY